MKEQILEVQNYFVNRITACDFDSYKIDSQPSGWVLFETIIDGFTIKFSVKRESSLYCAHDGYFKITVPDDRLQNLIRLIDDNKAKANAERIEKLKAELAQLETA